VVVTRSSRKRKKNFNRIKNPDARPGAASRVVLKDDRKETAPKTQEKPVARRKAAFAQGNLSQNKSVLGGRKGHAEGSPSAAPQFSTARKGRSPRDRAGQRLRGVQRSAEATKRTV